MGQMEEQAGSTAEAKLRVNFEGGIESTHWHE